MTSRQTSECQDERATKSPRSTRQQSKVGGQASDPWASHEHPLSSLNWLGPVRESENKYFNIKDVNTSSADPQFLIRDHASAWIFHCIVTKVTSSAPLLRLLGVHCRRAGFSWRADHESRRRYIGIHPY